MIQFTTAEKISELIRCFRWFVGLFFYSIITFWLPFFWTSSGGRNNFVEWGMGIGLAVGGLAVIYFVYRLFRITRSWAVWAFVPFALVPLLNLLALALLAARCSAEVTRLGGYARLFPPRVSAGLTAVALVAFGAFLIWGKASADLDHARLKREGQRVTGTLRMVTRHSVNFIPTGKSFDVEYAGRRKTFDVSGAIYNEHTLSGGKFTQHELPVIYLPAKPEVAELPGMLDFSVGSLWMYLIGVALVGLGGRLLLAVVLTRSGWSEGVP